MTSYILDNFLIEEEHFNSEEEFSFNIQKIVASILIPFILIHILERNKKKTVARKTTSAKEKKITNKLDVDKMFNAFISKMKNEDDTALTEKINALKLKVDKKPENESTQEKGAPALSENGKQTPILSIPLKNANSQNRKTPENSQIEKDKQILVEDKNKNSGNENEEEKEENSQSSQIITKTKETSQNWNEIKDGKSPHPYYNNERTSQIIPINPTIVLKKELTKTPDKEHVVFPHIPKNRPLSIMKKPINPSYSNPIPLPKASNAPNPANKKEKYSNTQKENYTNTQNKKPYNFSLKNPLVKREISNKSQTHHHVNPVHKSIHSSFSHSPYHFQNDSLHHKPNFIQSQLDYQLYELESSNFRLSQNLSKKIIKDNLQIDIASPAHAEIYQEIMAFNFNKIKDVKIIHLQN